MGPADDKRSEEAGALVEALKSASAGETLEALVRIGKSGIEELEPEVVPFLRHDDPELRAAAIRVLGFYWQLDRHRPAADEMAARDPDPSVRAAALMALAAYCRDTRDAPVLARFERVLRDAGEDAEVRAAAYRGILRTAGLPVSEWPDPTSAFDDIDRQVDWGLVERLVGR